MIKSLAVIGVDVGADAIAEALVDVDARRVARESRQELDRTFLHEVRDAGVHAGVPDFAAHVEVGVGVLRRTHDLADRVTQVRPRSAHEESGEGRIVRCQTDAKVVIELLRRQ